MRTKDHVVPKSKGGTRTVYACWTCNQVKADLSVEQFRTRCGGGEFWWEREERKTREIMAMDLSNPAIVSLPIVIPPLKKKVVPNPKRTGPNIVGFKQFVPPKILVPKIKKESKPKWNNSNGTAIRDVSGYRFGCMTASRYLGSKSKWECKCDCGALEVRSTKAILNARNLYDACIECRKPVGKYKSYFWHAMGVELHESEVFDMFYGRRIHEISKLSS